MIDTKNRISRQQVRHKCQSYRVANHKAQPNPFSLHKVYHALANKITHIRTSDSLVDHCLTLTEQTLHRLHRRFPTDSILNPQDITCAIEHVLQRNDITTSNTTIHHTNKNNRATMRSGYHPMKDTTNQQQETLAIKLQNHSTQRITIEHLGTHIESICKGLDVDPMTIVGKLKAYYPPQHKHKNIDDTLAECAQMLAAQTPDSDYGIAAARFLLKSLRQEALSYFGMNTPVIHPDAIKRHYGEYFYKYIRHAIQLGLLDPKFMRVFNLNLLAQSLIPDRDDDLKPTTLRALYDDYLIQTNKNIRLELPQVFFMRIAMGLALNEPKPNERAIELYNKLSSFDFLNNSPDMFGLSMIQTSHVSYAKREKPSKPEGLSELRSPYMRLMRSQEKTAGKSEANSRRPVH